MLKHIEPKTITLATAIVAASFLPGLARAQDHNHDVLSTVDATYVTESAETALAPGEKVENLFAKNMSQDYVLQKLTDDVYWFEANNYATIFYVGDEGVLVFDALEGVGARLLTAIAEVTDLPITTIVYSHDHADHIADVGVLLEAYPDARIVASTATVNLQAQLGSSFPPATETVDYPNGAFTFEDITVSLHGLTGSSHARDHAIWLLEGTGVVHLPDAINPDQPPFWAFGGWEGYMGYRDAINELDALDWDYLSGGHGNVGSREDIAFYHQFLDDLEASTAKALGTTPFGTGIEDFSALTAHTPMLPAWLNAISVKVTDELRPTYGNYYGYESATPKNAELVAFYMFSYR